MKTFKKLAVAFVVGGLGLGFASCSDDAYYEEPEKIKPLPPTVELPVAPVEPPVADQPIAPVPDPVI
ncbi:hypothetical protein OU798_21765 [Prolixibacteraceae bacterium Z1-6]|uniref:Uncharacterized protein n=1 Tax=Draconibacterium aestuarii TaxID=2998507 RepID=A0A9X3FGZ1_9BACT|nr:hypothetical protein [Prolixibacteraceae bacterium Z1-6]